MNKRLTRIFITAYAAVTVFCLAFGLIYEYFGFGVTSPFMHLAFLVPLVLGVVPRLVLLFSRKTLPFPDLGLAFWRLGIATLVTGSLFRGALDIYGTTSPLTVVYPVAGIALLVAGVLIIFMVEKGRDYLYHFLLKE